MVLLEAIFYVLGTIKYILLYCIVVYRIVSYCIKLHHNVW